MIYYSYYWILLPAFILSLWAQYYVGAQYKKYAKVLNAGHMTGYDAARKILDRNGLSGIKIEHISGQLTDHYDPRAGVIRLSDGVYGSDSVAAVGIAAHEAGHAVQYAQNYMPVKLRNSILPVTQIASGAALPMFLIGLMLSLEPLVNLGIILFASVLAFQLITLPVEFNASRRAVRIIDEGDFLSGNEIKGVKKVLFAAAMTYVAAMISALAQLLRLILIANGGRRR